MTWLWLNLILGAIIVSAIVGMPLWLVITRPDTAPDFADLPAWWRAGQRRAVPAPAANPASARTHAGHRLDRAA